MVKFESYILLILSMTIMHVDHSIGTVSRFAGPCPKMDPVSTFSPKLFKGEWFEYGNFFPIFENINRCTKFKFSDAINGVMNLELNGKNTLNFMTSMTRGSAKVAGSSGTLSVSLPFLMPTPKEYLVLGTDYNSWGVLWTCQERESDNVQNLVILMRQKSPAPSAVESALRTIASKNLSRFGFIPVDQLYC